MRNVHPCKRPILETVNSKDEEPLTGRGAPFEPLHASLWYMQIVSFAVYLTDTLIGPPTKHICNFAWSLHIHQDVLQWLWTIYQQQHGSLF